MITVTVQNHSHFAAFTLPCSENEMEKKLEELDRWDETNFTLFVDKVSEPEELSVLQDRFIDLDEVNYLAKRMDSFDRNEKKQFFAAASHCGFMQVKDLINLTFNLSCFTLVQDLSSMESVGRLHQLTLSGGLGEEDMEPSVFAKIGRELLESGRGKVTEYGILFVNEEIPFDEVYDGQVFPEYYYENCLCEVMMDYRERRNMPIFPVRNRPLKKHCGGWEVLIFPATASGCSIAISAMMYAKSFFKKSLRMRGCLCSMNWQRRSVISIQRNNGISWLPWQNWQM